ncbi:MAG: hypothetical protein IPH64_13075 [Comamonadaceae bacterium]|nr:hypothetical protein [Comamonadaceae bacterium]
MATRLQRGAFLMARALLIVGILTAMLVVPVYLKKEREKREAAVHEGGNGASQGSGLRPSPPAACIPT